MYLKRLLKPRCYNDVTVSQRIWTSFHNKAELSLRGKEQEWESEKSIWVILIWQPCAKGIDRITKKKQGLTQKFVHF